MTEKKFSELTLSESINDDDVFALSQKQAEGTWVSRGVTGATVKAELSNVSGSVMGGSWSSDYSNDFSKANAYWRTNDAMTWKNTATLSKVPGATSPLLFSCNLQTIPADVNGWLLPYALNVQQSSSGSQMTLIITLTVFGAATQLFDPATGVYGPLGKVDDIAYNPKYTLNYWWQLIG